MSYSSPHFQKLERLTVLMYDKSSQLHSVNTARRELFSKKGRSFENIPPTQVIENFQVNSKKIVKCYINAHMFCRMRSSIMFKEYHAYQAGIWAKCTEPRPDISSPEDWGWQWKDRSWEPVWITVPEAAKVCKELIKCCCKSERGCSRCKCFQANLVQICALASAQNDTI